MLRHRAGGVRVGFGDHLKLNFRKRSHRQQPDVRSPNHPEGVCN